MAHFDAVDHTTQWRDLSPRVGGSFDVFGNGKTAIKASFSRYVGIEGVVDRIVRHELGA